MDEIQEEAGRARHREVLRSFLRYLNERTGDYVLKGGASLAECYGLGRVSEDLDLDSTNREAIGRIVDGFCAENGYWYRAAKDTDTVKRFMIHYGEERGRDKPLKIEVSYRQREIGADKYAVRDGICVYNIDQIAMMKEMAYAGRDKIRDLYDVLFICKNYWDDLDGHVIDMIRNGFAYKGLESIDCLCEEQDDAQIDKDELAGDALEVFDMLGLIEGGARQDVSLTAVCGLPGSGKTAMAEEIAGGADGPCAVVSAARIAEKQRFVRGRADREEASRMIRREIGGRLGDGVSVVYDAANLTREDRAACLAAARDYGARAVAVVMDADAETALANALDAGARITRGRMEALAGRLAEQFPSEDEGWSEIRVEKVPERRLDGRLEEALAGIEEEEAAREAARARGREAGGRESP